MSFGQRFKQAREKQRLSQQALADKLDVTDGTISNYEKGVAFPRWDMIKKICDILEIDPNYIFWDDLSDKIKFKIIQDTQLKEEEIDLINNYNNLNSAGQNMSKEYIRLLSVDDKYTKLPQFSPEPQYEMVAYGGKGTKGTPPKVKEETTAHKKR